MSDAAAHLFPPPLTLHPERAQAREGWSERLETHLAAWTIGPRTRWFEARAARFVQTVNRLEPHFRAMDEATLRDSTAELREALHRAGFREPLVARAFALIRDVARRRIGLRHHDVQLRGGFAMLRGMVAEMETGEGKTLTATLTAGTAALAGSPVHVVTVNDYLAERDARTMEPIYRALGLRVGAIVHGIGPAERLTAYACEITYASNKEITFDYLRDRLALGRRRETLRLKLRRLQGAGAEGGKVVMRGLHFAIVDEADSVLVDEARTPLIISRQTDAGREQRWAEETLELVDALEADRDYCVLKDERRIELTAEGRDRLAEFGEELGGTWRSTIRREESARQGLSARHLFQLGEHYLVRDGKVQIVDEYTGRIMPDRSWSEGLHQLIESKEGCEVTSRKVPMARMTYQRFFRRYGRLAGMTGTAREVRRELWFVYGLAVIRIATCRPMQRRRLPTRICALAHDKWRLIVARASDASRQGRPVLIGTRSVTASETVSHWLTETGLEHVVLSAEQDRDEAEIIARAGDKGRITVATNMAGRGVDIRLAEGVVELGGLHVILSERHDARRIDRQLAGRCGRQGDPGSTEAILSLEDPLLELVSGHVLPRLAGARTFVGRWAGLLWFRRAQRRAERAHFRARRELMKSDRRLSSLLAISGGAE